MTAVALGRVERRGVESKGRLAPGRTFGQALAGGGQKLKGRSSSLPASADSTDSILDL